MLNPIPSGFLYVVPWSEFPIVPSYPHVCSAMVAIPHRPLLPSQPTRAAPNRLFRVPRFVFCEQGRGKACLSIRKHDHFTSTRETRQHVRALARNKPPALRAGPNRFFLASGFVPQIAGFRRAAVQIRGTKTTIWSHIEGWWRRPTTH